jgi:hypothetical protein
MEVLVDTSIMPRIPMATKLSHNHIHGSDVIGSCQTSTTLRLGSSRSRQAMNVEVIVIEASTNGGAHRHLNHAQDPNGRRAITQSHTWVRCE